MSLTHLLITSLVFLLPLFFLPFFSDFYGIPKLLLLVFVLLLFISKLIYSILKNHSLTLPASPLNFSIFSIITFTLISLIFNSEGRMESILSLGASLIALSLLSFFLTQNSSPRRLTQLVTYAFILTTTLLSMFTILQLLVFYQTNALPLFMQTRTFTPLGTPLSALTIIFIGFGVSIAHTLTSSSKRPLFMFASALNLVASVTYFSLMLKGQDLEPIILPFSATWSIFLDTAKSLHNLIFGVGFSNFTAIYTAVKPLFLNNTNFWNLSPTEGSSTILTLLITGGVPLTLALLSFGVTTLRQFNLLHQDTLPLKVGFILCLLALFVTPISLPALTLFFVFGALLTSSNSHNQVLKFSQPHLRYSATLLLTFFLLGAIYSTTQVALASHATYQAKLALEKSNGKELYDQSLRAVKLLPHHYANRVIYSQVNLNLASAISKNTTNPTEQERSQIAQLISQAVREAKAAITLRPSLSSNWQNLGNIYRNLIGVAEGADKFALESYAIAVTKDPGNPALRVEYGGLLQQLSQTQKDDQTKSSYLSRAETEYLTAINLRPTYANAYYNLSRVYLAQQEQDKAIAALEKTVAILGEKSPDYVTAKSELDALKSKPINKTPTPRHTSPTAPESTEPSNAEIFNPSPLPIPLAGGPVELPE